MTADVVLGEITVPSGELVLMDGGYLGLWSGHRPPEDVRPDDTPPAFDFEVVGPDAQTAARSFDRQLRPVAADHDDIGRQAQPRSRCR